MQISIVIPLLNEADSLPELHKWIVAVMEKNNYSYELIFVDDGSSDASWEIIANLQAKNPNVKGIKFLKNFGKSQGLNAGFKKAKGDVIITMDADLQDSPEEIPDLYTMVTQQNYDLVSGWKKKRYDSKIRKNIPSKLFNWAARKTSGIELNDFNCGLKAYQQKVIKSIDVTGEMHRYIPILAKNVGFKNIGEKPVQHQARKYGETKFGIDRFTNGFLDLITLWFLSKFGKRPMHLFGLMGTFMFLIGFFSTAYIGISKLFTVFYYHQKASLVTNNPLFYIALTTMILGTQLFIAGFIGEMILKNKKTSNLYYIEKEI
ncbi:glycosyltransferase involved in cell wall biosynthesis [Wenyingzhuangia heitensis]|uniref:Glycosyltransferase involved in cell wall biosynthesis n=1 Tax=Wenyingzhuangia heitensis TaxID=1487859 RepID=A0ABX0UCB0_9FLAO|nr:glycosyltransferase family 2 protein [Wenyingzhuangia heitensis]NIJ46462.1 glycosyltransferase involved in cell wall biosynthesis [Wenyingzhuangia heitensis]